MSIWKILPKVFANMLLLVLAVISILVTISIVRNTGHQWPIEAPEKESWEKGWVCIGNSDSHYQVPANQLQEDTNDDRVVSIVASRSYFSYQSFDMVTFLQTDQGNVLRYELGHKGTLFRVATFILGWVGLVRFVIKLPRWLRSWLRQS
jgi:hypothetical protein